MDRIHFNMATIPQREFSLKETVDSILPQCDELNIYMNNWDHVPDWLYHAKINFFCSRDEAGDLGDVGKFYRTSQQKGYSFTIDDDFIYPRNYASRLIQCIEQYDRKAVVSVHGRVIRPNLKSYYYEYERMYAASHTVPVNQFVHEVGTGVCSWHSDTIQPSLNIFKYSNMSDILFCEELQKRGIPMVVASHKANWLRGCTKHDGNYSIWASLRDDDKWITEYVNKIDWKLRTL